MRRMTLIFVVGCAALGLGLGLFLNSRNDDTPKLAEPAATTTTAAAPTTTAEVLGTVVTRPAVVPTTTAARAATPTTARAVTTPTTARKTTTTTAKKTTTTQGPTEVDCGGQRTDLAMRFDADGKSDPKANYATVTNIKSSGPAIVIDAIVIHFRYSDGTTNDVQVPNVAGVKVAPGATSPHLSFDNGGRVPEGQPAVSTDWHADNVPACPPQKG